MTDGLAIARLPALLSLGIPAVAGLGHLARAGAPADYAAINALALGLAIGLILWFRPRTHRAARRIVTAALLALLLLPLITGPYVSGIARWLPLGPLALHSGMLVVPLLVVLASRERGLEAPIVLAAVFAALLQPDGATGLALTFAAVGSYVATKDWRMGAVAGATFFASLVMWMRGELPAQPFVERVLVDAAMTQPLAAVLLFASLLASFFIMLHALPAPKLERYRWPERCSGFRWLQCCRTTPVR